MALQQYLWVKKQSLLLIFFKTQADCFQNRWALDIESFDPAQDRHRMMNGKMKKQMNSF